MSNNAPKQTATKGVIPLPHERARNNVKGQGWHATTVKQSTIPGAGYGRFSDVDVPKGTVILTKSVIPMTEVSSIHSVANDVILLFKNEGDFEKFISLYETEGQQTRDDIINFLPHFVFPHPNLDGVGLNFVSCSVNHGDPSKGDANFRFIIKDDYFIAETVADVKAGDELLLDYRDLGPVKEFWAQFCEKKGLSDVIYQKYTNFFAQINKTPHK